MLSDCLESLEAGQSLTHMGVLEQMNLEITHIPFGMCKFLVMTCTRYWVFYQNCVTAKNNTKLLHV